MAGLDSKTVGSLLSLTDDNFAKYHNFASLGGSQ